MKCSAAIVLPLLSLLSACQGLEFEAAEPEASDPPEASFMTGKADAFWGVEQEVLSFVNYYATTFEELHEDVGLNTRVATNILEHRLGPDGINRTADDDYFETLEELDQVPYVGPTTFQHLLDYLEARELEDWEPLEATGTCEITVVDYSGELDSSGVCQTERHTTTYPLTIRGRLYWSNANGPDPPLMPEEIFLDETIIQIDEIEDGNWMINPLEDYVCRITRWGLTDHFSVCSQMRPISLTLVESEGHNDWLHAQYSYGGLDTDALVDFTIFHFWDERLSTCVGQSFYFDCQANGFAWDSEYDPERDGYDPDYDPDYD